MSALGRKRTFCSVARARAPLSRCPARPRAHVSGKLDELIRLIAIASLLVTTTAAAQPTSKVGDPAPASLGVTPAEQPIVVGDGAGRITVVSFWASWCEPCRKELPMLEAIQNRVGAAYIRVVAVNIEDPLDFSRLARRLSDWKLTLTHDVDDKVSKAYGVKGIPHLVLIGRDGRILKVRRGYDESKLDQVVADINAALATK